MQLVEIKKVFEPGVKVMYPSKQPNKAIKTLDDVRESDYADDALIMWGSEYVVEIPSNTGKAKLKMK